MPDRTSDARTSVIKPTKRGFLGSRRCSNKRNSRVRCHIQHLEPRLPLAGNSFPTIDAIPDVSITEDTELQTILLGGITAGEGSPDSLRVSASSQNELLVSEPNVIYQAGQSEGILELQPVAEAHGSVTVVVTVEDSGPDNDDATVSDNGVTTMSFTVNVASVNDPPTLTEIEAVAYDLKAEALTVASSPIVPGLDYGESHPGSTFTSSLDLTPDGNGMIVGALGGTDVEAGYVEVYQRTNALSPWTQIGQQLAGDDESALGRAVTVNASNTRIAFSTGRAVSMMEFDSESELWVPLGTQITQPGIIASLAMDSEGALLAIAAADENGIPNAHLYRFDGTNWNLEQGNLTMGQDVEEDVEDQVALSQVAMSSDGTRLIHSIAGCGCSNAGFAKVYERNTTTGQWDPLGNRIEGEGSYGSATAISGDGKTIAIGAPQLATETDLFGNGLVEVLRFDSDSGQWSRFGDTITGSANAQQLGTTVALSEDASTLIIGSPGASSETINKAGKVSIFEFDHLTSTWQLVQEHHGLDANGSFGWRTATSSTGSSIITGARGSVSSTNKNGTLTSFSRAHAVSLGGITAGGFESQAVRITALSDQPTISGQPVIKYAGGANEAELLFLPNLEQAGIAQIEVTVEDPGLDGDFDTTSDNGLTTRTFSFGVGLSNFETQADRLSLELGQAGTTVRLSKNNDGTFLDIDGDRWIGIATDRILIPAESRMVLPDLQGFERVELVLEEERNIIFDDPTAWRLSTPVVDGQRFLRSLTSLEDPDEIIYLEGGAPWQNPIEPNDINGSGHVSPNDILLIINELAAKKFSDPQTGILANPLTIDTWPNRNFDQDGSGHSSAVDALRVINYLAKQSNGEGELAVPLPPQSPISTVPAVGSPLHLEAPHSLIDFTRSDSNSASTLDFRGPGSGAITTVSTTTPKPKLPESHSSTTAATLTTNSVEFNAVDETLRTWQ